MIRGYVQAAAAMENYKEIVAKRGMDRQRCFGQTRYDAYFLAAIKTAKLGFVFVTCSISKD